MAEETPISPLDNLGDPNAGINPRGNDPIDFEVFRGEGLSDPKSFFPITPPPQITRKQTSIRQSAVGNYPNLPPSNPQSKDKPSSEQFGQAFGQMLLAQADTKPKGDQFAKIYSYNESPNGDAFYDRYAYHSKFDELGFHPMRDNESLYNDQSNWGHDVLRMSKAFVPLYAGGIISGPKSLYRMAQGDFTEDPEHAQDYEYWNSVGSSSRGGAFGLVNNTALAFSYSAGILTETIAEIALGAFLTPETGGASLAAATANTGLKMSRLSKLWQGVKGVKGVGLFAEGMEAANNTLKGVNSVKGARTFWNSATGKFLKHMNPLQNTRQAYYNIKNADNMTGLAMAANGFGGFYADVRNINMALSEGRLEGGFQKNQLFNDLYKEYYLNNDGQAPPNHLQEQFMQTAEQASAESVLRNTLLIYASNKVVFPNLTNMGGGGARNFLKRKMDDVIKFKDGKMIWEAGKTVTKDGATKTIPGAYRWAPSSVKETVKAFKTQPLKTSLSMAGSYFRGNFMEGIEEVSQDVISKTIHDYYFDNFRAANREEFHYTEGAFETQTPYLEKALGSVISAEGLHTFGSGFLMGIFGGAVNRGAGALQIGYNKYLKDGKQQYDKYQELRTNYRENAAKALTELYNNTDKFFDGVLNNFSAQYRHSEDIQDADTKKRLDEQNGALVSQVITSLNNGTFDYFTSHLESLKDLSVEEFEQASGLEPGQGQNYHQQIDGIVSKAKDMQKKWDYYTEKMPAPISLENIDENDPRYEDIQLLNKGMQAAKHAAVFYSSAFENTTDRMVKISNAIISNPALKNITSTDGQVLFDNELLYSEISLLTNEIEALEGVTDQESKDRLKQNKQKLKNLEAYRDAKNIYENIVDRKMPYEIVRKQLKEQTGKEPTEEEVEAGVTNILGKKSDKAEEEVREMYFTTLKDYLNTLAKGEPIFDSDVEKIFGQLKDFHDIKEDRAAFAKLINQMNNPEMYMDIAQRNAGWMKDMFVNREEYFQELVNKRLEKKEINDLLNTLADSNVFIDPNDLMQYLEDGTEPKEFFDDTRKMVIRPGSTLYKEHMMILQKFKELQDSPKRKATEEQSKLDLEIEELERQKQLAIDELPLVQEEKKKISEMKPTGKLKSFSIKRLLVEAQAIEEGEIVAVIKTKDEETKVTFEVVEGTLLDENGDVVSDKNYKKRLRSAIAYSVEMSPDPKEVERVTAEYDARIEKLKKDFDNIEESRINDFFEEETLSSERLRAVDPKLHKQMLTEYLSDAETREIYDSADAQGKINLFDAYLNTDGRERVEELKARLKEETVEEVVVEKEEAPTTDKKADIEKKIQKEIKFLEDAVNDARFATNEANKTYWQKDLFKNKLKQLKDSLSKPITTGEQVARITLLLNSVRAALNTGISLSDPKSVELATELENTFQNIADEIIKQLPSSALAEYIDAFNDKVKTRGMSLEQDLMTYPDGHTSMDGKNQEYFLTKENVKTKINDKYDAELAALEEAPVKPKSKETSLQKVEQSIQKVFDDAQSELFDFSEEQKGKKVNGEFIPNNLGAQMFNAINKTLKGEVIDKAEAKKLFKEYSKEVHPDKHKDPLVKEVANKFFQAMTQARKQGRADVLKKLKTSFDEELSILTKETKKTTTPKDDRTAPPITKSQEQEDVPETVPEVEVTGEGFNYGNVKLDPGTKERVDKIYDRIINANNLESLDELMTEVLLENQIPSKINPIYDQSIIDNLVKDINTRKAQLNTTTEISLDPTQLNTNDTVYVQNDNTKSIRKVLPVGTEATIVEVNNKTKKVTLKVSLPNYKKEYSVTFDELRKNYNTVSDIMQEKQNSDKVVEPKKADNAAKEESIGNVKDLLNDRKQIKKIEKDNKDKSLDDLFDDTNEDDITECNN